MRDSSDNEYSSANDSLSSAIIQENGPIKTVIKADGSFKNAAGSRLADYTLYLTFSKDNSYVKALAVLRNSDNRYPAHLYFNSAEAIVPLNLGTSKTVEFARKVDTVSQNISSADSAYLYQGYSTDRVQPSECYNWLPPVAGTCDANYVYQYDQSQAGLKVQVGQNNLNALGNQNDWTQGWGEMKDQTGAGVSLAYRWMSGYWPAGFEFNGSGNSSIELFSKRNTKKSLNMVFRKHEEREIIWDFHSAAGDNKKTLYRVQYPLIAQAPFSHYQNTKAIFGQNEFVTPSEQTKFFTDMGHPELNPNLSAMWMYILYRSHGWGTGGGGNQTDFPLNDLQDFLRTGNPGFYLLGEQRTLFNNTALVRSDTDIASGFDPDPNWRSLSGGFIDMEHAHVLSIPFYYYLTGNEWIKDGFLDYGEYLNYTETLRPYYKMPSNPWNRAWDRKYRNLALIYEFSCSTGACNSNYGNYLKTWTDYLLDSRDTPPNQYPQGRNLERGYRYWETPLYDSLKYRDFQALVNIQIHPEAIWQALRVMNDTGLNYARKEELEDYLMGLAQFIFNEAYGEIPVGKSGGSVYNGTFGFGYFYQLDSYQDFNISGLTPYDASRIAVLGYEKTGDASYLAKAKKIIWAITDYATGRSPSELQDQALMYTHFNPPATWKPLSVSA
ncbi:MAG: hypothetical protein HYT12_05010, partial [Candidatus Liptonbacteria bacterium]|nr:hypothetical protein [Candidatus Liptonbacteria bacterium]